MRVIVLSDKKSRPFTREVTSLIKDTITATHKRLTYSSCESTSTLYPSLQFTANTSNDPIHRQGDTIEDTRVSLEPQGSHREHDQRIRSWNLAGTTWSQRLATTSGLSW
jgi:hypothetical protein